MIATRYSRDGVGALAHDEVEMGAPHHILEHLTDGLVLLDGDGGIRYLNPAAGNLLGMGEVEPGTPWDQVIEPGSDGDLIDTALNDGGGGERTAILRTPHGLHTVDLACTPVPEEHGAGVLLRLAPNRGAGMDSEVLYRARHDAVTGAYNRWELEQRLHAALRRTPTATLVLLDIDGFKRVNDSAGHAAGDALLRQLAQRVERRLRETDLIARLGGDEFAILLPACEPDQAYQRVNTLLAEFAAEPFVHGGCPFAITVSAGVAPILGEDPEAVLVEVDRACYAAKAQGGNCAMVMPG